MQPALHNIKIDTFEKKIIRIVWAYLYVKKNFQIKTTNKKKPQKIYHL